MRRALRFRHTLFFCNVVVSVACVPFVSMEMLFNFGCNHLRLDGLYTIRVGHGVGRAPALYGHAECITIWWGPESPHVIEHPATSSSMLPPLLWQMVRPDCWKQTRWIQFACVSEDAHIATASQQEVVQDSSLPPSVTDGTSNHDGRLSTIPEESSIDIPSEDTYFAGTYISGEDPAFEEKLTKALSEANMWCARICLCLLYTSPSPPD